MFGGFFCSSLSLSTVQEWRFDIAVCQRTPEDAECRKNVDDSPDLKNVKAAEWDVEVSKKTKSVEHENPVKEIKAITNST